MKAKDIKDEDVLRYLVPLQSSWTGLWYGHFKGIDDTVADVFYAMPEGTPPKVALAKMKILHRRGLVGGCPCGCRGDFEITDKGLELIDEKRTKPYSGY